MLGFGLVTVFKGEKIPDFALDYFLYFFRASFLSTYNFFFNNTSVVVTFLHWITFTCEVWKFSFLYTLKVHLNFDSVRFEHSTKPWLNQKSNYFVLYKNISMRWGFIHHPSPINVANSIEEIDTISLQKRECSFQWRDFCCSKLIQLMNIQLIFISYSQQPVLLFNLRYFFIKWDWRVL